MQRSGAEHRDQWLGPGDGSFGSGSTYSELIPKIDVHMRHECVNLIDRSDSFIAIDAYYACARVHFMCSNGTLDELWIKS